MSNFRNLVGCTLVLALIATQARAEIITPTSVSFSSQFAAASNLIDGSGLDGIGAIETQLHDNNENNMWQTFSANPTTDWVEFELDGLYDLSEAYIWQYNGPDGFGTPRPDREVSNIEISVAPDLVSPLVSLGNFNLAPAADQTAGPPAGEAAQVLALTGASAVRRVRIEIDGLHVVPPNPNVTLGDVAGLSEVRFGGVLVPEPTTVCLATVGAISLSMGVVRRRRTHQ